MLRDLTLSILTVISKQKNLKIDIIKSFNIKRFKRCFDIKNISSIENNKFNIINFN